MRVPEKFVDMGKYINHSYHSSIHAKASTARTDGMKAGITVIH